MKKSTFAMLILLLVFSAPIRAYAKIGDMGFFGGISEGERLPTTTELKILETGAGVRPQQKATPLEYKEIISVTGEPVEFEGLITVTTGAPDATKTSGSYNMTIVIAPSTTTGDVVLNRNITFQVNWRKEGRQYVKNLIPTSWAESIATPNGTYVLDYRQSSYTVSILEDHTPAVTYYRGDTSGHSVYNLDGARTTIDVSGSFYGYNCAWSKTETHSNDVTVSNNEWQLQYQISPSVTSNKILQYIDNAPTAISFAGNYRELLQTESWLQYRIFVKPNMFFDMPDTGEASINIPNIPEQLIAPDLNFLKGQFGEEDIRMLFSMQILDGVEKYYQPAQAITRAQYSTAIVKAVKIPIEQAAAQNPKKPTTYIIFSDVSEDRPDYPFIIAAYRAGITIGRDNASFSPDDGLERQEAIAIILRTLGLENLELDPTPVTPFADDYKVADWARKELYAAYRLNIIAPDINGEIRPNDIVSKAEAAALINRVIDYMRHDLAIDYTSHITGYPG